jgi:hypothetical protein
MASAISRTTLSFTWPRNLFQLFHPIGGVLASPLSHTETGAASDIFAGGGGSGAGASADARVNSITCGGRLPAVGRVSLSLSPSSAAL